MEGLRYFSLYKCMCTDTSVNMCLCTDQGLAIKSTQITFVNYSDYAIKL